MQPGDGPLHYHTKELRADKVISCYPEKLPVIRQSGTRVFSSLKTDDIEGAQPHSKDFRTNRSVDPLEPDYKLPTVEERPVTPPRFLRDQIDISDIEGAKSKPLYTKKVRNTNLDVSDIAEQRTEVKEIRPRTIDYMMLSSDVSINDPKPYEFRQADFNPNNPIYQWKHAEQPVASGCTLTNEKLLNRNVVERGDLSLKADDILENDRIKRERLYGSLRKTTKDTQSCIDIEGAKAMYSFNKLSDKCRRYYGKDPHDPSIRDKDYAFLCGAISGNKQPPIYSADFIGRRLSHSYSGAEKKGFGIKRSIGDETYDNPMSKADPTAYVPSHKDAPSVETKYELEHDREKYIAYTKLNPHIVPEYQPCPSEHVYKKKVELYADDSHMPHAGQVVGVKKYRTASELCETLPGPSRATLLEHEKPTVGRKEASNIGHWRKVVDRLVDASETYDREYYNEFNAARSTAVTLRDFSGGQQNTATAPILKERTKSSTMLRSCNVTKALQRTGRRTDEHEVQMVRSLPAY